MSTITIKEQKIEKQKGVVILPIKEYQRLVANNIPTYYLTGKKAIAADRLVKYGLREHKAGRTIKASSVKEALRIYESK